MTLVLSERDVEDVLTMDRCVEVLDAAFRDYASGRAASRPRTHTYTHLGEGRFYNFKSMDGAVPRYGVHALRFSSEILQRSDEPSGARTTRVAAASGGRYVGLVMLFDIHTTEPLAIIHDAGLQRMRVGATSALAAQVLSRDDSSTVGLFGTGWQAAMQLEGLARVRDIREVKVYSTNPSKRMAFADEMTARLEIPVRPAGEAREVVTGVDIVACATNSMEPVFDGRWLEAGQHVNSLQAGELDNVVYERAACIAVRSREISGHYLETNAPELPAPLQISRQAEAVPEGKIVELGKLLGHAEVGRRSSEEITMFGGSGTGTSSGLGIQFAAVGKVVYDGAKARGLGREIPTEWLLEAHQP